MTSVSIARSVLEPRSIALVGVSRDPSKVSGLALPYLRDAGYGGDVYVVNPSITQDVPGARAVPDVRELPEGIDLVFASVSAERTPRVVAELAARRAGTVVVGASGFSELGEEGAEREARLREAAAGGTRLIGPNCNGLYSVQAGVALGFNRSHGRRYRPGGIAIVSQSGALIGAIADLCTSSGAGLRGFFSTGNELDIRLVDLLEILAVDPDTSVIALVLDRVGDAARFRTACERARAKGKRVIAFKFGNTAAGRKASESHSARMAGDSATYDALFAASGVTRCSSLTELSVTAALLESRPAPRAPGALVISTSGAGGALTADALEQRGVPLVDLDEKARADLASTLRFVTPQNPVDVGAGGSNNARANFAALRRAAEGVCTVFFYLPPPTFAFAEQYSRGFVELVGEDRRQKTTAIAVMADRTDPQLVDAWLAAGVPTVSSVEEATAVIANLQPLAPPLVQGEAGFDTAAVDGDVLGEAESMAMMADAGIRFPRSFPADDAPSAVAAMERIGGTVVVKGVPAGVAHKSAAGLVAIGLSSAAAVAAAAEGIVDRISALAAAGAAAPLLVVEHVPDGLDLILSVKRDPEFGAVGLIGIGGTGAEAIGAYRVLLPPFSRGDVRAALGDLGISAQLAMRGDDTDSVAMTLTEALIGLARVLARGGVESMEVNPLRLLPTAELVALDALVITEERPDGRR